MRRTLLPWIVAFGILLLVSAGTVVALNTTTFGAGGFVRVYLDALARDDVSGALSLPGVRPAATGAAETVLLRDGTQAGLSNIRETGDEERGDTHLITFDWTSPGGAGSTTFQVHRIGTRFGLFPVWGFVTSPIATVSLTVAHDPRFTVNGIAEVSRIRANTAVDYAVLVPGSYSFGHSSHYLTAKPDVVLADTVNQTLHGTVDTEANTTFVSEVSSLIDARLRECATQTVLFPTGCPFGQAVDNRVSSTPVWSITHPPPISILPGTTFGTWAIPPTPGTAHLKVAVTSLYNGTSSEFDQDVPFQIHGEITLGAGDAISVTLH
ncbi:MAG: hypothetical protein HIU88_05735 [Acidobacteria bacterium]|nr:hypothetical protein [Acidobacteriota bacterium]